MDQLVRDLMKLKRIKLLALEQVKVAKHYSDAIAEKNRIVGDLTSSPELTICTTNYGAAMLLKQYGFKVRKAPLLYRLFSNMKTYEISVPD